MHEATHIQEPHNCQIAYDRVLSAVYCDISSVVKRLDDLFYTQISDTNNRICIKCGNSKPDSEFIKWRVGVKSQGDVFTTGNYCLDCNDLQNADKYLKEQLTKFEIEENIKLKMEEIPKEYIKLKAILLKINRKITNLKKEKL
jgi:predicted RNA-binding protein YlxR (DUF448 family)